MYKDIDINWDVFQYKFTGKTREVFEHLAYILFCYEFNIKTGIFRYFNQPYIETLPVKIGEECIGFQAKYYDAGTQIADKKTELKKAIDGAKTKYPEIDKFIIYTNKELSTSSKKDTVKPEYQTEIEQHGIEKNIKVEWRVKSHFEIMLMKPELELIRDYFFNPNTGIKGYLAQVNLHSQNKLDNIKSAINYRDQTIKINNNKYDILSFYESENSCLVIHGDGGTGKSGFAKDLLENETGPVIAFKATDFDVDSFAEFSRKFGEYTFEDYLKLFKDEERKICLIDSTEKVLIMNNHDTFIEFVNLLIKYKWKLIFTIRTVHKDNFINTFLHGITYQEFKMDTLLKQELKKLLQDLDLPLPEEDSYIDLICNLFYLKLYIEIAFESNSDISTIEKFIERIWTYKIKNTNHYRELDIRREKTICNITLYCAKKGIYYYEYQSDDDTEALSALKEDEIIFYDEVMRGYSLSHDIYEEIIFKHIFEDLYIKKEDSKTFFKKIGDSLVVRKNLRLWLKDKLMQETGDIKDFIIEIFYSNEISSIWQDEILVTLMGIENSQISLNFIKPLLAKDEYKLLFRAVFLLNTTCRIINNDFWNQVLTSEEQKTANLYRSTKPAGSGWGYIFNFIYECLSLIKWNTQNIMLVIECLYSWTLYNVKGIETKYAGLIALFLYEKVKTDKSLTYKFNDEKIKKINYVILSSAWEIDNELSAIIKEVISDTDFNHMHKYYDLCVQALSDVINCGNIVDSNPNLVFDFAKKYWFFKKENKYYSPRELESAYGINDSTSHDYYPSSALKTPIFRLLQSSPWETLDFIVELFNRTTLNYYNSEYAKKYDEMLIININLPNGQEIKQIASERLWLMHRGTYPNPNLLESILMALERWLLIVSKQEPKVIKTICLKLLNSQSAALTAVVVSLIEAYPEKLFHIACNLIPTKEIFILDNFRSVNENASNFMKGVVPVYKIFEDERIKTNNQDFRKKRLEEIIIEYQLNYHKQPDETLEDRNRILYRQLDMVFEKIDQLEEKYQFAYYRMDIRKLKPDTDNFIKHDGQTYVPLIAELPKSLIEIQNDTKAHSKEIFKYNDIYMWATARFEFKKDCEEYIEYENNPLIALKKAKEIWEGNINEYFYLQKYAPIYVFAVLLRDYQELISKDDFQYCEDKILNYIESSIESGNVIQAGSGFEAAIDTMPLIISNEDISDISLRKSIELLLILLLDSNKWAIQSFANKLWELDSNIALGIFYGFLELKPIYDTEVSIYNGISPIDFIKKNRHIVNKIIKNNYTMPNEFSNLNYNVLLKLNMLLSPIDETSLNITIKIGKQIWKVIFDEKYKKQDDFGRYIETEIDYITWLSKFLLGLSIEGQKTLIKAMEPYINSCENFALLLSDIISTQDKICNYDGFWNIWYNIQPIVISLCKRREERDRDISSKEYNDDLDQIVTNYLLAFRWWNEKTKSWHSLKEDNHVFFRYVSYEIGYNPSVLYAIGRVLNTVGYNYLSHGIDWLYGIINNNPHLEHKKLIVNTEYYIEEYMQRFVLEDRVNFKKKPVLRNKVIVVLNFLVNRGSTVGYMLRESIV